MTVPPKIAAAIAEYRNGHPDMYRGRPANGDVGELAILRVDAVARVVLVCNSNVHDGRVWVNFLMCTNDVDMATDLDVVVEPALTGAPYRLMIGGEMYGQAFVGDLDVRVGQIPTALAVAVWSTLFDDGQALSGFVNGDLVRTGLPLAGVDDPRRRFKQTELDDLVILRSPCRQVLIGHS